MLYDRIVFLRESNGLTQSELSKILGITRSSVNAWEMGVSLPSTQYIIALAQYFGVSTDYILGVAANSTLDISGLSDDDIQILYQLKRHFQKKNR